MQAKALKNEQLTLWFQISVYEPHEMEIFKCCYDFRGVKASMVFRNALARTSLQSFKTTSPLVCVLEPKVLVDTMGIR